MFELKILPNPSLGDLVLRSIEPAAVNERGQAILRYLCIDKDGGHKVGAGGFWTGLEMRSLGDFLPAALNDKEVIVGTQGRGLARWVRGKIKRLPGLGGAYYFPVTKNPILNASGLSAGFGKFVVDGIDKGQRGITWDLDRSTRIESPHHYPENYTIQIPTIAVADNGSVLCEFVASPPDQDRLPLRAAFLFRADGNVTEFPLPRRAADLCFSREGFLICTGSPGDELSGNMIVRMDGLKSITLPRVPGPDGAQIYSDICISSNGNVAGTFTSGQDSGAFLYSVEPYPSMIELPGKDGLYPRFVTSQRWVLGEIKRRSGRSFFLYDGFTLHNLEDLFPNDGKVRLTSISSVSNRGHILGVASVNGYSEPYLLVPTQ